MLAEREREEDRVNPAAGHLSAFTRPRTLVGSEMKRRREARRLGLPGREGGRGRSWRRTTALVYEEESFAVSALREGNSWGGQGISHFQEKMPSGLASPLAFYFASESPFLLDEAGAWFSRSIFLKKCWQGKIQSFSIVQAAWVLPHLFTEPVSAVAFTYVL